MSGLLINIDTHSGSGRIYLNTYSNKDSLTDNADRTLNNLKSAPSVTLKPISSSTCKINNFIRIKRTGMSECKLIL